MKNLIICLSILLLCSCSAKNKDAPAPKATSGVTQTQPVQTNTAPVAKSSVPTSSRAATTANQSDYKPKNEGWFVDLEEAFAESEKTGKPIMANFTGSDWCGWCKRLDKAVFHQAGFKDWAEENVVLLELDFPRRFRLPPDIAKQNRGLAQSFGVRGYPTVWVFDLMKDSNTGRFSIKALGKTGYTKTLREFTRTMDSYIAQRTQS